MNGTVVTMLGVLGIWMLICAWCGYRARFLGFLAVVTVGLGLNALWMFTSLNVAPLEANALMAQISAVLYALSAFGSGWLIGRLGRKFKASRITDRPDV